MAFEILRTVAIALLSEKPKQNTSRTSSRQSHASGTSEMFRGERAGFDSYCVRNANRPLDECKDDILEFVNRCISKAYQAGGEDMREGVLRQL